MKKRRFARIISGPSKEKLREAVRLQRVLRISIELRDEAKYFILIKIDGLQVICDQPLLLFLEGKWKIYSNTPFVDSRNFWACYEPQQEQGILVQWDRTAIRR